VYSACQSRPRYGPLEETTDPLLELPDPEDGRSLELDDTKALELEDGRSLELDDTKAMELEVHEAAEEESRTPNDDELPGPAALLPSPEETDVRDDDRTPWLLETGPLEDAPAPASTGSSVGFPGPVQPRAATTTAHIPVLMVLKTSSGPSARGAGRSILASRNATVACGAPRVPVVTARPHRCQRPVTHPPQAQVRPSRVDSGNWNVSPRGP
jgi:hypothetical protein